MKSLLHIDSSVFSENSVSRQLALELIEKLQGDVPSINVTHRSLVDDEIPHINGQWMEALATDEEKRSEKQQAMVAYSDRLIEEVQQADVLVLGAPMYNFTVPSTLKAWFDHIARAGVTFSYTSSGPQGLLKNKTAYVIATRGGIHKDAASDNVVPLVKTFLGFIGIEDVHFIYAEGLTMSQRDQGLAEARQAIEKVAA